METAAEQEVTDELRAWFSEQTLAGFEAPALRQTMLAAGWQAPAVAQLCAREATPSAAPAQALIGAQKIEPKPVTKTLELPEQAKSADAHATPPYVSVLASMPSRIDAGDRWVDVVAALRLPRLMVLDNFLSDYECDWLIEWARSKLTRSLTVVNDTGGEEANAIRTSEGMFFSRKQNALIAAVEARISRVAGVPEHHGEGLQVLKYQPGTQYEPHQDYFDVSAPGTPTLLQRGGQRIATVLMYLNTPTQGGSTVFPDANFEVAARRGQAVLFTYARPEAAARALHGGAVVVAGEKWVATKWFRAGAFE